MSYKIRKTMKLLWTAGSKWIKNLSFYMMYSPLTFTYLLVIKGHKYSDLSLKKHHTCDCHTSKQRSIVMACNLESHATILWCVISTKLNIGKKVTGLEIMTLNCEKI